RTPVLPPLPAPRRLFELGLELARHAVEVMVKQHVGGYTRCELQIVAATGDGVGRLAIKVAFRNDTHLVRQTGTQAPERERFVGAHASNQLAERGSAVQGDAPP